VPGGTLDEDATLSSGWFMTVLAVIPARAGSKGIVGKNLRPLLGKPLIAHTIEAALAASCIDRVVVSTDGADIAEVARACGADVPFMRPHDLALDVTPGVDVVLHALSWLEENERYRPDGVVVLQPTSPLRKAADIDAAHACWATSGADAAVSVTAVDKHPAWMVTLEARGRVSFFMGDEAVRSRRQDLARVYALNGAIYCIRRDVVLRERTLFPTETVGYVMDKARSVDIDDEVDLVTAEALMGWSARA
jgi:CMP-N,N'-diacetyllegionaminic acid synthase